jgi:GAF domain-containing protein
MPLDHHSLEASLAALNAAADQPDIADRRTLEDRLREVLAAACEVLPVDGIGLMLLDDSGALRVAGASDPASVALERVQQLLGVGPGVDCVRFGATVAVDDLAASDDYSEVWAALDRQAARAVLSVPVWIGEAVAGTLNALGARAHRWTADSIRATEAYAAVIAALLCLSAGALETPVNRLLDGQE